MRTLRGVLLLAAWRIAAAQTGPLPAPGNVTLPVEEYNRLLELASKPVKRPVSPPLPFVVNRAELKFQAGAETASGTVELDGDVFSEAAVKVPLISGMTVFDARQKGRDLPLQQEGGAAVAVLPAAAEFAVTLEGGLAVTAEAGRATMQIPAPAAGAVRLILAVAGEGTHVNLSPGLITGRSSANGQTVIEATLVPGQTATAWWATRENKPAPVQAPREVRFLSDVKTLVTVAPSQFTLTSLVEITVAQGEPTLFELAVPAGYELTAATGSTLVRRDQRPGALLLDVSPQKSHQFLISLERPLEGGEADVPFVSVKGAQRETGEMLVEGEGTLELAGKEAGGLKRMDLREASPYLRSLAHQQLQAAFRYRRQPSEDMRLGLSWVRFPDSALPPAVARQATVTTMVTAEGKSLTEVKLMLRNQSQPFLKVGLPAGATILTADVAGEKVKPVEGADGNRIPLLRPGFRPADEYAVSFVFLHAGAPFARKGGAELALPKMEIPIGLLEWEMFLPKQYQVKDFSGDAMARSLFGDLGPEDVVTVAAPPPRPPDFNVNLLPGQLGGYVVDSSGATVPHAQVFVLGVNGAQIAKTTSNAAGRWQVSNLPSGRIRIRVQSAGFQIEERTMDYDARHPQPQNAELRVGSVNESIDVSASTSQVLTPVPMQQIERQAKQNAVSVDTAPSGNIVNLQKRVAGVLPIRVDVPRAGNSFRFVRPLVVDEETKVAFRYKSR